MAAGIAAFCDLYPVDHALHLHSGGPTRLIRHPFFFFFFFASCDACPGKLKSLKTLLCATSRILPRRAVLASPIVLVNFQAKGSTGNLRLINGG